MEMSEAPWFALKGNLLGLLWSPVLCLQTSLPLPACTVPPSAPSLLYFHSSLTPLHSSQTPPLSPSPAAVVSPLPLGSS